MLFYLVVRNKLLLLLLLFDLLLFNLVPKVFLAISEKALVNEVGCC
jgi:hypothetical protein